MRISDWSSDVCSSDLKIRARIDDVVTNQQAAEGLKPWYGMLCKRPTFHDDYLQAFNQPNVPLVDTQGRGLDRITETGIVLAGDEDHIGRASCRGRGCKYVAVSVVDVSIKQTKNIIQAKKQK